VLHNSLERLKVFASYCFWDKGQCNLQLTEVLAQKGVRYDEVSLERKSDFICEVYRLIRDNPHDKNEFLRKSPYTWSYERKMEEY
jgi:hypothetical protein